jgi:alpha-1,2-mannosyltransferase
VALGVVAVALVVRLAGFVAAFGNESLQMDLAAFYAAGESVAAGLSPYENHVERDPPIWDGVNIFRHSRFLYPPLAARLFTALALLPYHTVKFAWMFASLAALAAAVWLSIRLFCPTVAVEGRIVIVAATAGFYPVRALLERGQIDAFTLLLLLGALTAMRGSRHDGLGGTALAVATLLKLHCVFFLPFLLIRRRWRVVAGFAVTAAILLGLDLAIDGPERVRDYASEQLPRIARHGEGGTRAMSLPGEAFREVLRGVEPGRTVMDGRVYAPAYSRFVLNATLVHSPIGRALRSIGLGPSLVSLVLLGAGLALLTLLAPGDDALCGLSVMVLILLCAPVTWAMSAVWLLPVLAVVVGRADSWRRPPVIACAVGLIVAGVPDVYERTVGTILAPFSDQKYVIAELLCLGGLLGVHWASLTARRNRRR